MHKVSFLSIFLLLSTNVLVAMEVSVSTISDKSKALSKFFKELEIVKNQKDNYLALTHLADAFYDLNDDKDKNIAIKEANKFDVSIPTVDMDLESSSESDASLSYGLISSDSECLSDDEYSNEKSNDDSDQNSSQEDVSEKIEKNVTSDEAADVLEKITIEILKLEQIIKKLEEERDSLFLKVSNFEKENSNLNKENDSISKYIANKKSEIAKLEEALKSIRRKASQARYAKILESDNNKLKQEIAKLKESIKK